MPRDWKVAPRVHDDVVQQILANRGIALDDHARFLSPNWERDTHAPGEFRQMSHAVARLFAALEKGERIVIHGDYDADGVCGSSLLYEAIREVRAKLPPSRHGGVGRGLRLDVFLPDRERDGYGVAMHTVERIAAEGATLLVTVDCGIANADQLDRAHALGMDVIVCDHHQLGDRLPAHALLLHPLAPGETYPNKTLCGTGVAFKLASALIDEARSRGADFPVGYEKWFLDLVAIATVTDVMPLVGENRVLEHFGLTVLRKTRRHGILALLTSAGTAAQDVDTETIGFRIGPRLNAAGRLSSAEYAFRALTSSTEQEAMVAAAELEALNRRRQDIFAKAYDEAKAMLTPHPHVHVVWNDNWLPGIVGLIAGRLASDFGVPAFAFARAGGAYVGSGRSVGGLHLVEGMAACGDIFVKRGGHPQACGLTIASEALLHTFRERICAFAAAWFGDAPPKLPLMVDAELPLEAADWDMLQCIRACAPFGEGNPQPLFVARHLEVVAAEPMGSRGTHVRLNVYDGTRALRKVMGFGFGERATQLHMGDRIDVVYVLEVNEWKGKKELQYRMVDYNHVIARNEFDE